VRSIESYREEFPIAREWAYLNHAATSPISQRVADAMKAAVDGLVRRGKMSTTLIVEGSALCRVNAAKLLNVEPDDVAFVPNTTEPIAYVANGLEWMDGDNVVLADIEYPANVYPWWAQERKGVELRWVKSVRGGPASRRGFRCYDYRAYARARCEHGRVLDGLSQRCCGTGRALQRAWRAAGGGRHPEPRRTAA